MIRLLDGPAEGAYLVKRAPLFLRAVIDEQGEADVLDQLDDVPKPREMVYVYRLEGTAGRLHLHFGGKGGWYAMASYRYLPDVDGEHLRGWKLWRDWCIERAGEPVDRETGEMKGDKP